MISIDSCPVTIRTSAHSVPSTPGWMGEVALIAQYLCKQGILSAIAEQVRFAQRRFGRYEVLDGCRPCSWGMQSVENAPLKLSTNGFLAFAYAFMALFGRERLPARSMLSCFLAALFASRLSRRLSTVFLSDGFSRPLDKEEHVAGLWDRQGTRLPRLRRGWHARGRLATGETSKLGSAHATEPFAPPACRLSTPAASVGKWCTRAPVAGQFWQPGPRTVPGRTAPRSGGSPVVLEGT